MKRYKLGQRRTKTDSHGNSATMPDMIECESGEYIKHSEYEQLLESIGAGGVSGRVTQPDQALLISMATRLRHDFGLLDKGAQALMLSEMCKLWEEVVGLGYYQPENRGMYLGMIASDDHIPDASNMMDQVEELGEREAFDLAYKKGDMLVMDGHYENPRKNQLFQAWIARAELAKHTNCNAYAERYRFIRSKVTASNARGKGSWSFHYESMPTPLNNPMKGSVAGHFDEAIDKARKEPIK